MPTGGCLCGRIRYEFDGEPAAYSACHCLPCQKTSGCSNSLNVAVPRDKFRIVQGSCKTFVRKGDSGKDVTYSFCADCPSIIKVTAESYPAVYILKLGTLDDQDLKDSAYPQREIYTRNRFGKMKPFECPQVE